MPNCINDYRARIGLFYPTIFPFSLRRARKADEKTFGKPLKTRFKGELFSWFAGLSLALVYVLCTVVLVRCMDVETNPGPGAPAQINMETNIDSQFSPLNCNISSYGAFLG